MFECDFRLGCDWLWKVDACFWFAIFVDDLCSNVMFGSAVIGYGKSMCVFVLPFLLMIGV